MNLFKFILLYWRAKLPHKTRAYLQLFFSIALSIAVVFVNLQLNTYSGKLFNAIQAYNLPTILNTLLIIGIIITVFVVFSAYQNYIQNVMEIQWRQWLTNFFLSKWLAKRNYYALETFQAPLENLDQRISEDIFTVINQFTNLFLGLLSSFLTLLLFGFVLYRLSTPLHLTILDHRFTLYGNLFWIALIYSALMTYLTFTIGRPLIHLRFLQQRFEAFFRYHLMKIRENSEAIASYRGEAAEQASLSQKFINIMNNFLTIAKRTRMLNYLTYATRNLAQFIPILIALPGYFAHTYQLGGISQISQAFAVTGDALSFLIYSYTNITLLLSSYRRLKELECAIDEAAIKVSPLQLEMTRSREIKATALSLYKPDGMLMLKDIGFTIQGGEKILIQGPSGIGKSTLLRVIAGLWPFAEGKLTRPDCPLFFLPQKPYLQTLPLIATLSFPNTQLFKAEDVSAYLKLTDLSHLMPQLDQTADWSKILSLGEMQRLSLIRALLHQPSLLLLDEVTSNLNEHLEQKLYRLLLQTLPHATIISVGHRSSLTAFHDRIFNLGEFLHAI